MPVLFIITILVVVVGVYFVAIGRGGEMSYEPADHAPLDLGPVSAADIALLRPPTAMWGYNVQVTDEALDHIARAMRERDVRIAHLEQLLGSLDREAIRAEFRGSHARQDPEHRQDPEQPRDEDILAFPAPHEIPSTGAPAHPRPQFVSPTVWAPQTNLVLKASSSAKAPPAPEAREATQPSEILDSSEAGEPRESTQPSEIQSPHEATQPSATQPDDHEAGPQGSYDTYGWWAEQAEAERDQADGPDEAGSAETVPNASSPQARERQRDPAGPARTKPADPPDDESLAAAEEQAW